MVPQTTDGRVLFAVPWHDVVIVGTTDTPLEDRLLDPIAHEDEIQFILDNAVMYMSKKPTKADIALSKIRKLYLIEKKIAALDDAEKKTARQKLSVPLGFPRARQPESRQTRSKATGGASAGRVCSVSPPVEAPPKTDNVSRNKTVLAGGSSPATATSPSETHPGGRRARQTLKSPAAAPALKLCHTRSKSTTVFASTPYLNAPR